MMFRILLVLLQYIDRLFRILYLYFCINEETKSENKQFNSINYIVMTSARKLMGICNYCIFLRLHKLSTYRQFHQPYTRAFFVRTLFWQLFSSYIHIEKAAKTTFVHNICMYNVDEIVYLPSISSTLQALVFHTDVVLAAFTMCM